MKAKIQVPRGQSLQKVGRGRSGVGSGRARKVFLELRIRQARAELEAYKASTSTPCPQHAAPWTLDTGPGQPLGGSPLHSVDFSKEDSFLS